MSQYGAMGYATQGADHAAILAHYYTGTQLAKPSAGPQEVRVLLQDGAADRAQRRGRASPARARWTRRRPTPPSAGSSGGGRWSPSVGRDLGTYRTPLAIIGGPGGIADPRPRAERRHERALPRQPRAAARGDRRGVGDQRARPRELRPRGRRRRDAAARGRRRRCAPRPSPPGPTPSPRRRRATASTSTPTRARRSTRASPVRPRRPTPPSRGDARARSSPSPASRS